MCQIIDSWSQPGPCQRVNSCAVQRKGNQAQGSRKNKFPELALRFGSDLADPIEQNRRNSLLFRGVCPPPAEGSVKVADPPLAWMG
jgi:hypothetical protein